MHDFLHFGFSFRLIKLQFLLDSISHKFLFEFVTGLFFEVLGVGSFQKYVNFSGPNLGLFELLVWLEDFQLLVHLLQLLAFLVVGLVFGIVVL